MTDKRECRKCLLHEMPDAKYYENMYFYIEHIDEGIKTSEKMYQQRLAICKECESLLSGMCRICGCFVEVRAAVRKNYCPDVNRRW